MQFSRAAVFPDNVANVIRESAVFDAIDDYLGHSDLPVRDLAPRLEINRSRQTG